MSAVAPRGVFTCREDGTIRVHVVPDTGRWAEVVQRDAWDARPASWLVTYSDGRVMGGEWDNPTSLFKLLGAWVLSGAVASARQAQGEGEDAA